MAKKTATKAKKSEPKMTVGGKRSDDQKVWALIGIIPFLGYIVVALSKKGGDYALFYAKQGLVLGVTWIIAWLLAALFSLVPLFGPVFAAFIWLVFAVLIIFGIIYSLSGEAKDIPLVGEFAGRF